MGLSNRQPGAPSGKSQQPPAPSTAQQQINSWGGQPSGAMQPAQQGGLGAQFGTQQEAMMGRAQTGQAPTSLGMQTGSTAQAMMGGNYGGNIADRQMPGGMGGMTPAYANDAQQAQQALQKAGGVPAYQPRPPVAAAMPPGTAALGGGVAPRRGATLAQALQRRTGNTWK